MADRLRQEIVRPGILEPHALQQLTDELYTTHTQIFEGVDKEAFARYVVYSKAEDTAILVFRDPQGAIVGYTAVHRYERELGGKTCDVFRAETGMLRAYRGSGALLTFTIRFVLKHWLAHPGRPAYYLGSLVHPSSYTMISNIVTEVWPNLERPVPEDMLRFMCDLADEFHLEMVDPRTPLVRVVGWKTRDTEVERNYWQNCQKPRARFFVESNPGYSEGHGLLTLIPLSREVVFSSLRRYARSRARRQGDRLQEALRTRGVLSDQLKSGAVPGILQGVSMFHGLEPEELRQLADVSRVVSVPAGQYVLRQNDPSDSMYLIVSGAAYVIVERDGQEVILDELAQWGVFGEMALLTGARRSASIRAASALRLLRIDREPFLEVLKTSQALHDTVWAGFARRQFDSYISSSRRYAHLTRQERRAWVASGRCLPLGVQETLAARDCAFVFVLNGTVELERSGGWQSMTGPALGEVGGEVRLSSPRGAFVVLLPAMGAPARAVGTAA